ncbi:protein serine/threonine phosphatase 2C [Artomyces pyxidatus]|uniref:Protein serine/threonine phosphatase 2C n=1 Tax=Artomyces pyxidatus TaxID=48021 RepID=A0ACB8TBL7_9AGAM|nr:protein serine/threonine phosphatase 2C [Artomyces pyxidatus]
MGWPAAGQLWTFRKLAEPRLTAELARLSGATIIGTAHCVSFQPCPNPEEASQDRYVVQEWHVGGRTWRFAAIFDGHAGHEMADHAMIHLPALLQKALQASLEGWGDTTEPGTISHIMSRSISEFDEEATSDILKMFPGGEEELSKLTDQEISDIINTEENSPKVVRCMRGTTVLVSLIDPLGRDFWVASLGDCQAALGTQQRSGRWDTSILSSNHNGIDPAEAQRIRNEHPGEPEIMLRDRVLGCIAVTRALGDHLFKLPRIYTERVFFNSKVLFRARAAIPEVLPRIVTPPYLSSRADVRHVRLSPPSSDDGYKPEQVLIMCSDGLVDLYSDRNSLDESARHWMKAVEYREVDAESNLALRLLRDALGGDDETLVSRMITVEMTERWMDDTTIIVQKL